MGNDGIMSTDIILKIRIIVLRISIAKFEYNTTEQPFGMFIVCENRLPDIYMYVENLHFFH